MARTIAARLKAHGFNLVGTGGNCTAYQRLDANNEIEELITDAIAPTAPTRLRQRVSVGTQNHSDPQDDGTSNESLGYTLGAVLAALDDPRDEYYLLSLRLDNGYGQSRKADTPVIRRRMRPARWPWRKYNGLRIPKAGWRTSIDLNFQTTDRAYGYVWPILGGTRFRASWEFLGDGRVIDQDLGEYYTARAAKIGVQNALVAEYR